MANPPSSSDPISKNTNTTLNLKCTRSKVSSVAPAFFISDDEAAVIPISKYTMNEAKFDPSKTNNAATASEAKSAVEEVADDLVLRDGLVAARLQEVERVSLAGRLLDLRLAGPPAGPETVVVEVAASWS
ncbi:unnamed protein product [Miscanthus lutarioriparius]|uniref:Uncharacterized protein n=1 Tax=Miscanthus lutarioriparius TaxID=422564 RepID=A0A811R559_9POAL|nr:unnamed protein product [Miscanthus lutarioriparius]